MLLIENRANRNLRKKNASYMYVAVLTPTTTQQYKTQKNKNIKNMFLNFYKRTLYICDANRQTDKQTEKRRVKHNFLRGQWRH